MLLGLVSFLFAAFVGRCRLPSPRCGDAVLSLRPVIAVRRREWVDLLLLVRAEGQDVLLLPFALCSGCPLSTRKELPWASDWGKSLLCCFVAWHNSSSFVLIGKL